MNLARNTEGSEFNRRGFIRSGVAVNYLGLTGSQQQVPPVA